MEVIILIENNLTIFILIPFCLTWDYCQKQEILYIIQIALKGLNLDRKTQIEILDFIKQKVTPSTLTLGNALLTVVRNKNPFRFCVCEFTLLGTHSNNRFTEESSKILSKVSKHSSIRAKSDLVSECHSWLVDKKTNPQSSYLPLFCFVS
jgi:hypothetical protein